MILGIDFTKSNEWTGDLILILENASHVDEMIQWFLFNVVNLVAGRYSFNRKSLHAIGKRQNPYEQAISIIGHTLSPFDEDGLIPCFGFGDG